MSDNLDVVDTIPNITTPRFDSGHNIDDLVANSGCGKSNESNGEDQRFNNIKDSKIIEICLEAQYNTMNRKETNKSESVNPPPYGDITTPEINCFSEKIDQIGSYSKINPNPYDNHSNIPPPDSTRKQHTKTRKKDKNNKDSYDIVGNKQDNNSIAEHYINKKQLILPLQYTIPFDKIPTKPPLYIHKNLDGTHELYYNKRYLGNTSQLEELYGVKNESMDTCPPGSTSVQILARPGQFPLPSTPYGTHILRPMYNIDDLNIPLSDGSRDIEFKRPWCHFCCTGCLHMSIPILYLFIIASAIVSIITKIYGLATFTIFALVGAFILITIACSITVWSPKRLTQSNVHQTVTFPIQAQYKTSTTIPPYLLNPEQYKQQLELDMYTLYDYRKNINNYTFTICTQQQYTTLDNIKQHINIVRSEIPIFAFLITASHTENHRGRKKSSKVTVVTHRKWVHVPIMAYNSYGEQSDDFINRIIDESNGKELLINYMPVFHFKSYSSNDNTPNSISSDNNNNNNNNNDVENNINKATTGPLHNNSVKDNNNNNIIKEHNNQDEYINIIQSILYNKYKDLDKLVRIEYSPYTRQLGIDTRIIPSSSLSSPSSSLNTKYNPRTSLESAVDIYTPYDDDIRRYATPGQYKCMIPLGISCIWFWCFSCRYRQITYKMHYDLIMPTVESYKQLLDGDLKTCEINTYVPYEAPQIYTLKMTK